MTGACDRDTLLEAKRLGFTDDVIAMMSAFPRRQSKSPQNVAYHSVILDS